MGEFDCESVIDFQLYLCFIFAHSSASRLVNKQANIFKINIWYQSAKQISVEEHWIYTSNAKTSQHTLYKEYNISIMNMA